MNWIDYAIIAILVFGVFSGFMKGLVKSVSSIICLIISILVAKYYYRVVALFLVHNTPIEEKIAAYLSERAFTQNLLLAPLRESAVFSASKSFASDMNGFVTLLIINAISVALIFLAARIVLAIAEGVLVGVVKLPGLKEVNSIGGAMVGLVKNILIVMLLFTLITPISALKPFNFIAEGLEASMFTQYFHEYNFILGWIWSAALEFLNK